MVVSFEQCDANLCSECNSLLSRRVCTECGLVNSENRIDFAYLPRSYFKDETRCSSREPLFRSLPKIIINNNTYPYLRPIFRRLNNLKITKYNESKKIQAFNTLKIKSKELKIPEHFFQYLFKTYLRFEGDINFRSFNTNDFLAGITYYVVMKEDLPITLREIADEYGISKSSLYRSINILSTKYNFPIKPPRFEAFAYRYLSDLRLPFPHLRKVIFIYNILRISSPAKIHSSSVRMLSAIIFTMCLGNTKGAFKRVSDFFDVDKQWLKKRVEFSTRYFVETMCFFILICSTISRRYYEIFLF